MHGFRGVRVGGAPIFRGVKWSALCVLGSIGFMPIFGFITFWALLLLAYENPPPPPKKKKQRKQFLPYMSNIVIKILYFF